jgi:tetratricopeptide (TPR) repeat protein
MDLEVKKLLSFLLVLIFILTPITYAENNTNTLNQNKTLTENNTNVSQTFNHPLSEDMKEAQRLEELGDRADDTIYYEKSLKLNPNNRDIWIKTLERQGWRGEWKKMVEYANNALKLYPNHVEIMYYKTIALKHLKRYKEALTTINKALELPPQKPEDVPWDKIAITKIELLTLKGNIFYKQGKIKEALTYYDKALELSPGNLYVWEVKGNVFYDQGNFRKALTCYKHIPPSNLKVSWKMGDIYSLYNNPKNALIYYDKVTMLDPTNADVWYKKGFILQKYDRKKALNCFNKGKNIVSLTQWKDAWSRILQWKKSHNGKLPDYVTIPKRNIGKHIIAKKKIAKKTYLNLKKRWDQDLSRQGCVKPTSMLIKE